MPQIFISYSRKDGAFVRKLAGDLEKAGYTVWWDVSGLRGGDDWVRVIPAAIKASDTFIVVLSPNSAISQWVEKEYTQALYLRKKIIPIMIEQSDVPFGLNNINYIDFISDDYAINLNKLLNALGYTGKTVVPIVPASRILGKLFFPVLIGILFVLALFKTFNNVPLLSTFTPTAIPTHLPSQTPTPSFTATDTPTLTPTITSTITLAPTITETLTRGPTWTVSPTKPTFNILIYCVNSLYANTINVRSGPGIIYAPFGEPLQVGKCLGFSARNEDATWLQIAPNQADPLLEQYASGWIFRELLGLGMEGPIDLPAVTLTPTPMPGDTPTVTPTFTPTETPSPTETIMSVP